MNLEQCTTIREVIAVLKEMPDPRARRGVRHPWWVILTTIIGALLAGCDQVRAMAQWAADHRELLGAYLPLHQGMTPSESTLQRALRRVDLHELVALVNQVQGSTEPEVELEGVAMDGKTLRGTKGLGAAVHVVQLARHQDGALLRVAEVGAKANEYTSAPVLLAGYTLRGRVVTGDAMFCQRRLAEYIKGRGGEWLFAVKANQPELLEALEAHFEAPRGGPQALDIREARTSGRSHGRVERRVLEASADLVEQLEWPGARQVIRRTTVREVQGQRTVEVSYWLTSLGPEQADPALLERLCRGHWSIENPVNWTRDVTFGEDRCTTRTGRAPLALAVLRSLVRWLVVHRAKFAHVPEGRRHYAHQPAAALDLLGAKRL